MTPDHLLAFEADIAREFEAGKIKSPVHLSGGNERELIEYFKNVAADDWVFCSWRSHYHCLLKGVPRDELKAAILAGRSVSLCFPDHKILSSGIVGGTSPIAVGVAWEIKHSGSKARVHVFIGDMTAESGIVHECTKYAMRHDLPVQWVVEDNGLSVCTQTQESWGCEPSRPRVRGYSYKLSRPHVGIGKWVRF